MQPKVKIIIGAVVFCGTCGLIIFLVWFFRKKEDVSGKGNNIGSNDNNQRVEGGKDSEAKESSDSSEVSSELFGVPIPTKEDIRKELVPEKRGTIAAQRVSLKFFNKNYKEFEKVLNLNEEGETLFKSLQDAEEISDIFQVLTNMHFRQKQENVEKKCKLIDLHLETIEVYMRETSEDPIVTEGLKKIRKCSGSSFPVDLSKKLELLSYWYDILMNITDMQSLWSYYKLTDTVSRIDFGSKTMCPDFFLSDDYYIRQISFNDLRALKREKAYQIMGARTVGELLEAIGSLEYQEESEFFNCLTTLSTLYFDDDVYSIFYSLYSLREEQEKGFDGEGFIKSLVKRTLVSPPLGFKLNKFTLHLLERLFLAITKLYEAEGKQKEADEWKAFHADAEIILILGLDNNASNKPIFESYFTLKYSPNAENLEKFLSSFPVIDDSLSERLGYLLYPDHPLYVTNLLRLIPEMSVNLVCDNIIRAKNIKEYKQFEMRKECELPLVIGIFDDQIIGPLFKAIYPSLSIPKNIRLTPELQVFQKAMHAFFHRLNSYAEYHNLKHSRETFWDDAEVTLSPSVGFITAEIQRLMTPETANLLNAYEGLITAIEKDDPEFSNRMTEHLNRVKAKL